jgi:hypothetical protein
METQIESNYPLLNLPIIANGLCEAILETAEMQYWGKIMAQCPGDVYINEEMLACVNKEIPVLAFNRVLFSKRESLHSKVTYETISEFYQQNGVKRWMIQIPETYLIDELSEILSKEGYLKHNSWIKLGAPISQVTIIPNQRRIEEVIDEESANEFARILINAFDWPDVVFGPLSRLYRVSGFKAYLVYQDHIPIAAGAIHFCGNIASLAIAGTDSNYRNRNAQKLLIHFRAAMAKENGCHFLLSETGDHSLEKPNISFLNMTKMGFQLVYKRHNFLKEV